MRRVLEIRVGMGIIGDFVPTNSTVHRVDNNRFLQLSIYKRHVNMISRIYSLQCMLMIYRVSFERRLLDPHLSFRNLTIQSIMFLEGA